jgi:hypothetical protein
MTPAPPKRSASFAIYWRHQRVTADRCCASSRRLDGPNLFYIHELKCVARACDEAAQRARAARDAIQYCDGNTERLRLDGLAMIYSRLAGYYRKETQEREALPMHIAPQAAAGKK